LNLVFVYADSPGEWNCSQYLAIDPMNAINKLEGHSAKAIHINDFVTNNEETQKLISAADLVMVERNCFQDTLTLMMFWKVRGQNFGVCFDDGYSVMHPKNVSYNFWMKGEVDGVDAEGKPTKGIMNPPPLKQLGWGIQMAKFLQVVSPALMEDWKRYNDECHIINHHIVLEKYLNVEPLYKHDDTWISWSGSLSHVSSFENSGLLRAFRKIVRNRKNVKIVITGDRRVFDLVDIPITKKIYSPFVPADKYQALLKSFDIFTIPLADEYDKRRSQIKPLESMALSIPFLASDFPNYAHMKPYGNFTNNTWQEWTDKLEDMIEHLSDYKEKAKEVGFPFAQTQDINASIPERLDLYQRMIDLPYK
jgi:hypothetical protein